MEDVIRLLIPIMALLIPLTVVASIFIVQPVVKALTRLAEVQNSRPKQVTEHGPTDLEQRMAHIERMLQRVLEDQEFQRQLRSGSPSVSRPVDDQEPSPSNPHS
ncbi:MAG: hypothetical protein ACRENP_04090 [Longimicrobiales bacterium]